MGLDMYFEKIVNPEKEGKLKCLSQVDTEVVIYFRKFFSLDEMLERGHSISENDLDNIFHAFENGFGNTRINELGFGEYVKQLLEAKDALYAAVRSNGLMYYAG